MFKPILAIVIFFLPVLVNATVCDEWFKKSKIKQDKNCLMNCVVADVDMGTYTCPKQCEKFCKNIKKSEKYLFSLSDLYPGLSPQERALAAREPSKMLEAYKLSWDTELLCSTIYKVSDTNDESDACRHFVWSSLLTNKLGEEFAQTVLDAHESEPLQPQEQKSMDTANNRLGVLAALKMIKNKKFSNEAVLEEFQQHLKSKKLIVLDKE